MVEIMLYFAIFDIYWFSDGHCERIENNNIYR